MTSVPIRDPLADHLITPQNAALIVVNYQRNQFRSSMDSDLLVENVVSTSKLAKRFGLPIVHSTVGVAAGQDSQRSRSSPTYSRTTHRSTERRSTRGKTPTSSPRFARPDGAN